MANAVLAMAAVATVACHHDSPHVSATQNTAAQLAVLDPCGWLDRAAVEHAVGAQLAADPLRVVNTDSPQPSPQGEACLFKILGAAEAADLIAMQVMPDESGVVRGSMANLQVREPRLVASGTDSGGWDFVADVPGGVSFWQRGRFAVLVRTAGQADRVPGLVNALLTAVRDVPFTLHEGDPSTAPTGQDPCALIQEHEAVRELGPLTNQPYRSVKGTALVHGAGGSCSYFLGQHRAVVLTPTWRGGVKLFRLLGGAQRLTQSAGLGSTHPLDEGDWDAMTTGPGDSLYALKGEHLIQLQYVTAHLTQDQAIALLKNAFPRL